MALNIVCDLCKNIVNLGPGEVDFYNGPQNDWQWLRQVKSGGLDLLPETLCNICLDRIVIAREDAEKRIRLNITQPINTLARSRSSSSSSPSRRRARTPIRTSTVPTSLGAAVINIEAQNDFWHFVNERHNVYLNKEAGKPKPWTQDSILQQWKFCNVFRKLDKQSQWLINNIIEPHKDLDPATLLFNIFVFRSFNWYPTYEYLSVAMNNGEWFEEWDNPKVQDLLRTAVGLNNQLISSAYMIRGLEGKPKWESIPDTLNQIYKDKDELIQVVTSSNELQKAYDFIIFKNYWGWGPFTTYQIMLDLTYTPILNNPSDLNSWCTFGPGAERGLREIWPDIPLTSEWMLEAAKTLLIDQVKYREPQVPELNLQDIEFCLCELSKYRRIKAGGKGKERYNGTY